MGLTCPLCKSKVRLPKGYRDQSVTVFCAECASIMMGDITAAIKKDARQKKNKRRKK